MASFHALTNEVNVNAFKHLPVTRTLDEIDEMTASRLQGKNRHYRRPGHWTKKEGHLYDLSQQHQRRAWDINASFLPLKTATRYRGSRSTKGAHRRKRFENSRGFLRHSDDHQCHHPEPGAQSQYDASVRPWTSDEDRTLLRCVTASMDRNGSVDWNGMSRLFDDRSPRDLELRWKTAHQLKNAKSRRAIDKAHWREIEVFNWIALRELGVKLPQIAEMLPRHTKQAVESFHRQHARACGLSKKLLPSKQISNDCSARSGSDIRNAFFLVFASSSEPSLADEAGHDNKSDGNSSGVDNHSDDDSSGDGSNSGYDEPRYRRHPNGPQPGEKSQEDDNASGKDSDDHDGGRDGRGSQYASFTLTTQESAASGPSWPEFDCRRRWHNSQVSSPPTTPELSSCVSALSDIDDIDDDRMSLTDFMDCRIRGRDNDEFDEKDAMRAGILAKRRHKNDFDDNEGASLAGNLSKGLFADAHHTSVQAYHAHLSSRSSREQRYRPVRGLVVHEPNNPSFVAPRTSKLMFRLVTQAGDAVPETPHGPSPSASGAESAITAPTDNVSLEMNVEGQNGGNNNVAEGIPSSPLVSQHGESGYLSSLGATQAGESEFSTGSQTAQELSRMHILDQDIYALADAVWEGVVYFASAAFGW